MSSLEDILPEMAGVFAAQESALENCVAVLSTQLQNLGLDCSRQVRRVATLESSQRTLLATIASLQDTVSALQQQNELLVQHQSSQSGELDALRELAGKAPEPVDLTGFKATIAQEMEAMEAQTAAVVQAIVTEQIDASETKLTQLLNERMLEASNRAFLQAQQSEETFQAQLEMLEKKFDFLSKIKMDIKDIGKRMDKQDQTLDDMRTGLALLAKSVGSDEIDDDEDSDHHADAENPDRRKPSLVADAPMLVMPMTITMGTAIEEEDNATEQEELPLEDPPTDEPQPPAAAEEAEVEAALPSAEEPPSELVEPLNDAPAEEPPQPSAPVPVEEKPTEQIADTAPDVEEPNQQEDPPDVETQPEETPAPSPSVEPEIVAQAPQPESETPPPSGALQDEPVEEPIVHVDEPERPPSRRPTPPVPVVEPRPASAPVVHPPAPSKPATPMSIDESDDESEDKDDFRNMSLMPMQATQRPSHPQLQHMPSAPSLSTVAYIRSRRQERSAKRGSRRESSLDLPDSTRQQRIPLSRDEIKVLWMHMFNKIVQLKRLQSINGSSPERTLFRKQNISMGARVKRLEETTVDLEDTIEFLETNIQTNGTTLQALNQAVTQSSTTLEKKTRKLDELQRMQGQSIVGMEEKFEALEAEFRRMRNVARRDSTQSSATATAITQIASEMHNVTARLIDQTKLVEDHESKLHRLLQSDLPNLTTSIQSTLLELRTEVDFKTRELAKDLVKAVENLRAGQAAGHQRLEAQLVGYTDALYRDLLVLTSAILVGAELAAKHGAAKPSSSPTKKSKQKSPLDVSVALLHSVLGTFEIDCRKALASGGSAMETSDTGALVSVLFDKLQNFRHDLTKLKDQADKASAIATAGESDSPSRTKGFEDHLVLICTNQLRTLEEILVSQSRPNVATDTKDDTNEESALVLAHVKDLVIQLRAVLFLLVLHAQLIEPPHQIQLLQSTQSSMDTKLMAHEFALSQLATVEAVVKMMNGRLDSFMDMSFSFAKDADVKKSIQDMMNASDELKEELVKQVDVTHGDALKRDELMERELLQLAGRVQKKLDKDEMLWTQEVLERQLQNVAKGALGEEDLLDIQRALRTKMDKTQFQLLLQQQHAKLQELGIGNGNTSLYGAGGNQPLLGATRCISCDGELPPSASQIRETVREEVQQEVAKALAAARHHVPPGIAQSTSSSSSSPTFNASSHRSMDKHKRDLLMAALQQRK